MRSADDPRPPPGAVRDPPRRHGVPVELTITRIALPGPPTFTGYIREITERVRAQEALQASRARLVGVADEERKRINVRVTNEGSALVVNVLDDGVGGADLEGSGLRGLADRVEAIGGRLSVMSPPGQGTQLIAAIPLE
jgi:hypothetical protein